MVVQKALTALALLAFNVLMLSLAVALPAARSRGDVGTAFLPMAVAVAGMIFAAVYLIGTRHGADAGDEPVTPRGVTFLAIFVLATVLMNYTGLPIALAVAGGSAVLLSERGKRLWLALTVSVCVAFIAKLGFGWLLNVPLP